MPTLTPAVYAAARALAADTRADRAITNLPIDRRGGGNLDRQIDRWKRAKARAARAKAKATAAERLDNRANAKAVLATHVDAIVATHSRQFGATALRKKLISMAKWEPKKLIALVSKLVA